MVGFPSKNVVDMCVYILHGSPMPLRERPVSLGAARLTVEPPPRYPSAMVNVTNRCNLHCAHCFIFRDGNPNQPEGEMKAERMLAEIERLRDRHGIYRILWMGGEPMIRWRMLERAVQLFAHNTITTSRGDDIKPAVRIKVSGDGVRWIRQVIADQQGGEVLTAIIFIPDNSIRIRQRGQNIPVVATIVVHRKNALRTLRIGVNNLRRVETTAAQIFPPDNISISRGTTSAIRLAEKRVCVTAS